MLWSKKIPRAKNFTFEKYKIDTKRSTISFYYKVEFQNKKKRTYKDVLVLKGLEPDMWGKIPEPVLETTLQALLLMLGINYWQVFPTRDIRIDSFVLTKEQAHFWDTLYLNGLGEFFYDMQMNFHDLVAFPYSESAVVPALTRIDLPARALLLNGAGKDSILSAEILKESGASFDFFSFAPTPAHKRIAKLVGAKTVEVDRKRDGRVEFIASLFGVSTAYPSVSTFTFIAVLISELLGYNSIIFSNEKSADFGNLTYRGLEVNHQWCKSSEAEKIINEYIQKFITPSISTSSLLRQYNEIEIVKRFVKYPKYLPYFTSCNNYFWLPWPIQLLFRKAYWCRNCPKCVFLFACFSAFLPKREVVQMFGGDLYAKKSLLPLFRRILGIEGFKPLDCVGEPNEMILAMRLAISHGEYTNEPAVELFNKYFL